MFLAFALVTVLLFGHASGKGNCNQCQASCKTDCTCTCSRRRLADTFREDEQDEVCEVSMAEARKYNGRLIKMIKKAKKANMGDRVALTVKDIQETCYQNAQEAIVQMGEAWTTMEAMNKKGIDIEGTDVQKTVGELYENIVYMKQCLAYTEMALRYDRNTLLWTWLMSNGDANERDSACGTLVNKINGGLKAGEIEGAKMLNSDAGEVIQLENTKFARKLAKAEENAGIGKELIKAVGMIAPIAGSLFANVCDIWQGLDTF